MGGLTSRYLIISASGAKGVNEVELRFDDVATLLDQISNK